MTKRTFRLSESRPDAKRDVDDEIAFHLEMRARELMEQGLSVEDARRQAAAAFGDLGSIRADLRHERDDRNQERQRREWWNGVRMDVAYSLRTLRKNPGFAFAAVATLGLGFGAALAVFTVVNGVLLRPLPYKDPSRITTVWMSEQNGTGGTYNLPLTSGFYTDLERDARSFATMAAFRAWPYSLEGDGGTEPEPVAGARVSPALFDVLGVRPLIGTPFTKETAVPGGPRVALISFPLWQRRFGGDASIVGKQVTLSGTSFTLVGVMPEGFAFPRGAELPAPLRFGLRTEVWTPLVFDSTDLGNYGTQNLSAVARYNTGVDRAAAQSEVSGLLRRFLDANAPAVKLDYRLVPLAEQAGGKVKRGLLILLGAVACLLLIACANVASLLLARATSRQRELAVRAALGAGRVRVARQLVTENLVLAAVGGALGVLISYLGTKVMLALVPGSMPRADDIGLDWRVLTTAALLAIATGIVFGVATAFSVKWTRLAGELHSGGTRMTDSHRWGRQILVGTEVALSLMLLISAALLTRSFINLQHVQPGFDARGVLTADVSLPRPGGFNPAVDGPKWSATFAELSARLNQTRGIVAAGGISSLPLSGATEYGGIRIPGRAPDPPGQGPNAQYNVVSGSYFQAARIPVIAGRPFDGTDVARGASIVVNREFARRYLGGETNVVGRAITPTFTFTDATAHTIVGVVENVKQVALDDDPAPQVYVSQSQMPYPGLTLVLRVDGNPLDAVPLLRRELRAVSPAFSMNEVQTMQDIFDRSLARQRFSMTLIGVFAAAALTLAIVGLYGVVTLIVGQRGREIGVRLALGARPMDVVRMIVAESSRVSVAGVAVGVAAAFAITRVLGALLYDVSANDAFTFAGAALAVMLVSIAAALIPARRASRVDPSVTLRSD